MATIDGYKVHLFLLVFIIILFLCSKMIFKSAQSFQGKKKIYEFGFFPEDPLLKNLLTKADVVCSLSTETSLPLGKGVPRQ